MRQLTSGYLLALRSGLGPPCISLYQPTHRHHPDSQQDPIRYRNLRRDMEASLREKYPAREVRALVEKYQALDRDEHFWNHRTDGLAILGSPDTFEMFELQRPVRERLIIADNFYIKPLLRILQSADRYQILCLTRNEARLYEGNRDALDPVDLIDVPATITAALGEELTEPRITVRSSPAGTTWYHGAGEKADEVDSDRDRFFRIVDRAILEHHSRPSGLPLMLAALTEHHAPFRSVSHNPFLMAEGLQTNPAALDEEQLRVLAWQQIEPVYIARLAGLIERYHTARSRQMAFDDVAEVARGAAAGRVGTLLVEADRRIPGTLDPASGRIEPGDLAHPAVGDVLDDLADMVLRMKGQVVVVPAERMPSRTGVTATYRF